MRSKFKAVRLCWIIILVVILLLSSACENKTGPTNNAARTPETSGMGQRNEAPINEEQASNNLEKPSTDELTSSSQEQAMFRGNQERNGVYNTTGIQGPAELKWKFETKDGIYSSPTVAGGIVYVGSRDGNFYALDSKTGQEKWRFETGNAVRSSSAIAKGVVYFGSHDGSLYAVESETGKEKWRFKTGRGVESSPVIAEGLVYFGSFDGNLYAVESESGKEKWRFEKGDMVGSSPAIADGTVYFGSYDGYLYAVDSKTGEEIWKFKTKDSIYSTPAVADGVVYFGSMDGNFYAVESNTGAEKWSFTTKGALVWSSPAVFDGTVYFGAYDGNLYALDSMTGQLKWRFWTGKRSIYSSPAIVNEIIYFGGHDGNLYAVDSNTGEKIWHYETRARIESSPAVSDGFVYFGSDDGHLYALAEARANKETDEPSGAAENNEYYLNSATAEERKVTLIEPKETTRFTSETDMYPLARKYHVIKRTENGITRWIVQDFGNPQSFVLEKDCNGRVFVTQYQREGEPEVEKIEITDELKSRGLDGSFNLSQIEVKGSYESKKFFDFKLSNGENWALFSSQWKANQHLRTVPLHRFNIVDTASTLNYSEDKSHLYEVYLKQEGQKKYVMTRDEKEQKLVAYALPPEIGEVKEMFWTHDYGHQAVYLAATYKSEVGGGLFTFKLELPQGIMTKGQALVEWKEQFQPAWRFTGDLPYNYLVAGTKDTILVLGDDGLISGYHDQSYLYGVDRKTGEKKWSIYGGYLPVYYYVSGDEQTMTAAVKVKDNHAPRIVRMDMNTGNTIWEKQAEDWKDYYITLAGSDGAVLLALQKWVENRLTGKLVAMEEENGNVLWEKELDSDERLITAYRPLPAAIVVGQNEIKAYEPSTGKLIWQLRGSIDPSEVRQNFHRFRVVNDPRLWAEGKQERNYWFAMKDSFRLVDLATGEVLHTLENKGNRRISVLNDEYLIIRDNDGSELLQGDVHSKLYSIKEQKILWTKKENIRSSLVHEGKLYYTTGEKIKAVDLVSGEELWATSFATRFSKQLVLIGSELVVPGEEGIFVFDSESGRFLYQVADFSLADAEARFLLNYYGMLTKLKDGIYLGSNSGYLELLKTNLPPNKC